MHGVEFLTLAEVMEIHHDQITRYGGWGGIRDLQMLLSALAVPQATFGGTHLHADLFEMAAAYAFHLCRTGTFGKGDLAQLFHRLSRGVQERRS